MGMIHRNNWGNFYGKTDIYYKKNIKQPLTFCTGFGVLLRNFQYWGPSLVAYKKV